MRIFLVVVLLVALALVVGPYFLAPAFLVAHRDLLQFLWYLGVILVFIVVLILITN
jgi:hypothetical protein